MITIVIPAAAAIQRVRVLSCRVSGVCSLRGAREHPGDLPDLGAGSGGGDHHHRASVRDRRVHERHVRLVSRSEIGSVGDLDALGRRHALPRQRGLVDLQRARLDDPSVRGHVVAGGQQHDVADDHVLGVDLGVGPVAAHSRGRLDHRLERVHRAFSLPLLPKPDDRVEHRDQNQQHPRAPLLDRQRHDRRGDEDDLHVAAVLPQEPLPARDRWFGRQSVGAVALEQLGGPLTGQADRKVHVKPLCDLVGGHAVPAVARPGGLLDRRRPRRRHRPASVAAGAGGASSATGDELGAGA